MKKYSIILMSILSCLTFTACTIPNVGSTVNSGFPQSITESHSKTTIVAPPSYGPAYMPPSAINQVPMQQNATFQSQQSVNEREVTSMRYNIVSPTPSYPDYVFIQKEKVAEQESKSI